MELRDRFAVHFAAALVDAFPEAPEIARRAYDLADAMLEERERRLDREERDALVAEASRKPRGLLDEPQPMIEDDEPDWEPPYDPSWDLEPRWSSEPVRGPGLARTSPPEAAAVKEERTA